MVSRERISTKSISSVLGLLLIAGLIVAGDAFAVIPVPTSCQNDVIDPCLSNVLCSRPREVQDAAGGGSEAT